MTADRPATPPPTSPEEIAMAPYDQLRKEIVDHPVRHTEMPTEHAISLPVPTLRWSVPAVACFAGPAARAPGRPLRLGTPDRWWALHPQSRRLVGYGLVAALPFAGTGLADEVVVDRTGRTIGEVAEELRLLGELMDAAAPAFFAGGPADATLRHDLLAVLTSAVTPAALPWYQALAPDLLSWLEG